MNWYNYVGGDPVNFVDPLGLFGDGPNGDFEEWENYSEFRKWMECDRPQPEGRCSSFFAEDDAIVVIADRVVQGPPDCPDELRINLSASFGATVIGTPKEGSNIGLKGDVTGGGFGSCYIFC